MRTDSHGGNADIEYGHHLVHAAKVAFASDANTTVTSVVYLITVGAVPLHLSMRAIFTTIGTLKLTEGVTATDGSAIGWTAFNRIENPSKRIPVSTISKTPTGVAGGVALPVHNVVANAPTVPGIRVGIEYNLLPSTKYLVTLTLASGNANIEFEGYEEAST